MPGMKKTHRKLIPFFAIILVILTACAGPLEVKYEPRTQGQFKSREPHAVFVTRFEDKRDLSKRAFKDPKTIGRILSTVSDMTGEELTLSEEVALIVTRAFEKELAISGFTIVDDPGKAGYIVSGEVAELSLDVGPKDAIDLSLLTRVTNGRTGETIWSGVESEKEERFAGVMGNSRTTLSNYIAATLQKTVRRSISGFGPRLSSAGAQPDAKEENKTKATDETTGTFTVTSAPERAKVYIDGVYYGLTPLTIELAPGVYGITVKTKGFQTVTEKVSVRQGATTVLELELEGE